MNFRLRIDETARAGLPAAELRQSGVELGDANLHVSLGDELDLRAPIE